MGGTSGCSKVTELRERDDRSGLKWLFEMQRTIQVIHIFVGFVAQSLFLQVALYSLPIYFLEGRAKQRKLNMFNQRHLQREN